MAENIMNDTSDAALAAAEQAAAQAGFPRFTWLRKEATARHGATMSGAFDLARSFLHGNAALLEILEDQDFDCPERSFGTGRKGDLVRFLVTVNELAADRLAELCDDINDEADKAVAAAVDFDTRR